MRPRLAVFFTFALLNAFPSAAEAAKAPSAIQVGERVLVNGSLHRKCSARVNSIPSPGFALLQFDRAACGDASVPYELHRLQRLSFVPAAHSFAVGDAVAVKGHFGRSCAGKVSEISRSGYAAVELDAQLCADSEGLYKAADLRKVSFVTEASAGDRRFTVGQKVRAKGIHEGETCRGEIRRLTDNGLAMVAFEELTCANASRFFELGELEAVKAPAVRRHASGELIFQRVMREIASQKKTKKDARL